MYDEVGAWSQNGWEPSVKSKVVHVYETSTLQATASFRYLSVWLQLSVLCILHTAYNVVGKMLYIMTGNMDSSPFFFVVRTCTYQKIGGVDNAELCVCACKETCHGQWRETALNWLNGSTKWSRRSRPCRNSGDTLTHAVGSASVRLRAPVSAVAVGTRVPGGATFRYRRGPHRSATSPTEEAAVARTNGVLSADIIVSPFLIAQPNPTHHSLNPTKPNPTKLNALTFEQSRSNRTLPIYEQTLSRCDTANVFNRTQTRNDRHVMTMWIAMFG